MNRNTNKYLFLSLFKMKYLLLSVWIISLPLIIGCEEDDVFRIKGRSLMGVTTTLFKFKNRIQDEKGIRTSYEKYDESGRKIELYGYDSLGSLSQRTIYTYTYPNLPVTETGYDGSGKLLYQYIYSYSFQVNTRVIYKDYLTKSNGFKVTKSYDSKGYLIEQDYYDCDDVFVYKYIFSYDSYGTILEGAKYLNNNNLDLRFTYKRDANGRVLEQTYLNADGTFYSKTTYTLDQNGRTLETLYFRKSLTVYDTKYSFVYDQKGNKIEETTYGSDGNIISSYNYIYNSDSKITHKLYSNSAGPLYLLKYSYEYYII
jgi:hypothetical protein